MRVRRWESISLSTQYEAPRLQDGASRKGSFVNIVPLDPAYKAGLAGHVPAKCLTAGS